jgi:hypothetical protein
MKHFSMVAIIALLGLSLLLIAGCAKKAAKEVDPNQPGPAETQTCVVCGKKFDPSVVLPKLNPFPAAMCCSQDCANKYLADPKKYTNTQRPANAPAPGQASTPAPADK